MPWIYKRRLIAERWHCKPWEVDEAPMDEVNTELIIMGIVGDARHA